MNDSISTKDTQTEQVFTLEEAKASYPGSYQIQRLVETSTNCWIKSDQKTMPRIVPDTYTNIPYPAYLWFGYLAGLNHQPGTRYYIMDTRRKIKRLHNPGRTGRD
jgi:hypothetical protein